MLHNSKQNINLAPLNFGPTTGEYYISTNGVRVLPTKESWADWRGDYMRTAVMIYKNIPSFEELMSFAEQFENEFNEWVKKS